ncbi:DUF4625 domain-containing protein [Labilibacter sediminis]|nr:DUF4625 domain-containing protein [Labilibacter sediminis]
MKYTAILTALILLLFASCNNDDIDTTKPEIEIIKPVAAEGEDHIEFHQGDSFDFESKFTDNLELKSYKVEIHYNGDGHEHGAQTKSATAEDHVEWDQEWTGDLDGKEDVAKITMEVPENAEPGEYHLGVYCFDAAGNETQAFIEIHVEEEGVLH